MLPQDPFILLSYVNTKLRDSFPSLESFCGDAGVPVEELLAKLEGAGFRYDPEQRQFK